MAGLKSAKNFAGKFGPKKKKSSSSKKGVLSARKVKKMHDARVEYPEPFEKDHELYKEGQGTERWAKKGHGGTTKTPKSGVASKKKKGK